jgi:hypothetical protein
MAEAMCVGYGMDGETNSCDGEGTGSQGFADERHYDAREVEVFEDIGPEFHR